MSQSTYKFKHTNVDLEGYMQDRRFVAQRKRRDAEILVKEAVAIEEDMMELSISLEHVEERR